MKIFYVILICSILGSSYGYAAGGKSAAVPASTRHAQELKKLDGLAAADKSESREELEGLGYKLQKDIDDLGTDKELLKTARDKSLNWRTRFLILEHIERADNKNISQDEKISLYSDALLDAQEHGQVRKLAAQALMEPSRTDPKARKALASAARDKSLPDDVLWSVMVSVGSSGMDDVDTLAGLMNHKPKTSNDLAINLNAVRALGESKDPRAIGMLFKILDESHPDSYFNVTALEQLDIVIRFKPKEMEKLRPMLTPRLMKLLDDRSHYGLSRQMAGRMLLRMNEREAIPKILKWIKPQSEGGGDVSDVDWAFEILAEFRAKEAIPELQKAIDNVPNDPRWVVYKKIMERDRGEFPKSVPRYITLQECLKKLKGEPYDKKYVSLPWNLD